MGIFIITYFSPNLIAKVIAVLLNLFNFLRLMYYSLNITKTFYFCFLYIKKKKVYHCNKKLLIVISLKKYKNQSYAAFKKNKNKDDIPFALYWFIIFLCIC